MVMNAIPADLILGLAAPLIERVRYTVFAELADSAPRLCWRAHDEVMTIAPQVPRPMTARQSTRCIANVCSFSMTAVRES
jgi:hypothetical protein